MKLPLRVTGPLSVLQKVRLRHAVLQAIRDFFDTRGYVEIDAPTLISANAVEAYIDPLSTNVHSPDELGDERKFLMTSPELHMKRLLAHGLKKIFFAGHVFRDREASPIHSNEFLMLETYTVGCTLEFLIDQCEELFCVLAKSVAHCLQLECDDLVDTDRLIFDRISMASSWEKFAEIDLLAALTKIGSHDKNALVEAVLSANESLRENADFEDAFTHIMLTKVEPKIGIDRPCVIYDWPAQSAALSALNPKNPLLAQRFEIYWKGLELANAFAELTDAAIQEKRFEEANLLRMARGVEPLPVDKTFLRDLAEMPPSCGIAIGIDRLIAVFIGKKDLSEVTFLLPVEMH